jgi:hypothetical protein
MLGWLALAPAVFALLCLVNAPYGRYARRGWGPSINARWGWCLMETPSWLVLTLCLVYGERAPGAAALALYGLWMAHYLYRSVLYPVALVTKAHPMPLVIVVLGAGFNLVNAGLNGWWLFSTGEVRDAAWLMDPRFVAGVAVFACGVAIHLSSDAILRRQRADSGGAYVVPDRGLHRLVASPNYLGEIVEWSGWALAAWSLPALSFVVWSVANLGPRAAANRAWYRKTFKEYPANRRRLIPFVW